jgi:succinylglutamate desuccinylase
MAALRLQRLDAVPAGLITTAPERLHRILPGPSLIHLEGRLRPPLFVSVLLHGNETTGFIALQGLLQKYSGRPLPRALSVFIGNVAAAREGLRRLEGQHDYNRTWPGTEAPQSEEAAVMRQVVDEMAQRGVFASIDIHNNTGLNPHYACVSRLDHRVLQLATLFSRLVVYIAQPLGIQSAAFSALCPAVTVECGKPDQRPGAQHALEYMDSCLHLSAIPDHAVPGHDLDLLRTVAQVTIRPGVSFGFQEKDADLVLHDHLDRLNFTDLPAGTMLGRWRRRSRAMPLLALDDGGRDVSREYFSLDEGRLVLRRPAMPSMLTLDERIIRQDCLGYLMERCPSQI